jgi:1-acyl-sn-glycerol-3-phosphate acyltransferase
MSGLRRFFIPGCKAGARILHNYFSKMKKYARHPEKYPIEERSLNGKILAAKVSNDLSVITYIEGLENIPNDQFSYFVGNHLSEFDPFIPFAMLDKPVSYIGKYEIRNFPFVGTFLKSLSGEFMDRKDLKQSLKVMGRIEEDLKKQTKNWVIFPEGTRNKDSRSLCLNFHHGTFRPPMRAGVPIVPFVIIGTDRVFRSNPIYKKCPISVKILKPITFNEYKNMTSQELASEVRTRIQRVLSFEMREKDHLKMKELNPNYHPF